MKTIYACIFTLFLAWPAISQAQQDTLAIQTSAVCGMCKSKIEKAVRFEKGVRSAELNLETGKVTIIYKTAKTSPDKLRKAITSLGYQADDEPADPKAYEKLDACCKKPE